MALWLSRKPVLVIVIPMVLPDDVPIPIYEVVVLSVKLTTEVGISTATTMTSRGENPSVIVRELVPVPV